jgi:hypothetical protein
MLALKAHHGSSNFESTRPVIVLAKAEPRISAIT